MNPLYFPHLGLIVPLLFYIDNFSIEIQNKWMMY